MTHAVTEYANTSRSIAGIRAKLSTLLRTLLAVPIKVALWFVVIPFTCVHQSRKSLIRRIGVMAATLPLSCAGMANPSLLLFTMLTLALTSATTEKLLLSLCRKLLAMLQALQGVPAAIAWLHKAAYLELGPALYAATPFSTQGHFFPKRFLYSDKLVAACPSTWQPGKSWQKKPPHHTHFLPPKYPNCSTRIRRPRHPSQLAASCSKYQLSQHPDRSALFLSPKHRNCSTCIRQPRHPSHLTASCPKKRDPSL